MTTSEHSTATRNMTEGTVTWANNPLAMHYLRLIEYRCRQNDAWALPEWCDPQCPYCAARHAKGN